VLPLPPPLATAQAGRPSLPELQLGAVVPPTGAEGAGAFLSPLWAQVDLPQGDADDVPQLQEQAVAEGEGGSMTANEWAAWVGAVSGMVP
jgi:hypothetical protein